MVRELTCITCPMGCRLKAETSPSGELSVTGNRCPRGAAYAREELLAPKRTVTATIRARGKAEPGSALGPREGGGARRIPCKSAAPFPKERVAELLAAIYALEAPLPVKRGQVLLRDALGLGIDVVATRSLG